MVTGSNGEIFSTTKFWVKGGKTEEFSLISTLATKLLSLPVSNVACKRIFSKVNKKNFMAYFYGWSSTASRLEPLRRGSLLFTTKFPEIPGTHFIDFGRMKG